METFSCIDTLCHFHSNKWKPLALINTNLFLWFLLLLCGLVHGQEHPGMLLPRQLGMTLRKGQGQKQTDDKNCVPSCICLGGDKNITVDCSSRNLSVVPTKMGAFTISLDLRQNNISSIPGDTFHDLKFLEHLNLAFNRLQYIPDALFSTFIHLRTLNLAHNQLQKFSQFTFQHLTELQELHLDGNQLDTLAEGCFQNLHRLSVLWLNGSQITVLPSSTFRHTTSLKALTLADNKITAIPQHAFDNLKNLSILLLFNNRLEQVGTHSFSGLVNLTVLQLDRNLLSEVPSGLSQLPKLKTLLLSDNRISYIPDNSFVNNTRLASLHINNNPIQSFGRYAFSHLPALENLVLSEARQQTIFPDLTGNVQLTSLALDRGKINKVPANLCQQVPNLTRFDIHSNQLASIPRMTGCRHLKTMNLKHNKIRSLEGALFQDLHALIDLTLSDNHIEELPESAFVGLAALNSLNLKNNHIKKIHQKAFAPLHNLEELNLGNNIFPELPTEGLENLHHLDTYNNYHLEDFPSREHFPHVETLVLSWAYHCCEYLEDENKSPSNAQAAKESAHLLDIDFHNNTDQFFGIRPIGDQKGVVANLTSGLQAHERDMWEDVDPDLYNFYSDVNLIYNRKQVTCRPLPGPFWPCNDLMGWWFIRCGMWVVVLLALLGNSIVLVVSIVGRNKKDVPRFLICNLACADLLMGVYLGFLAVVDASSFGEFKKYAIKWQTSGWCQTAGFLGVLSSELSVYTLTVITMERYYAITHAVHINKRLSLKQSTYIMSCGWLFSLIMAVLPLTGISDYRKFAVCLPFETSDAVSLGYVAFIMLMNMLAFLLIVACYSRMYWAIRGSSAWNSNDSRVAKRMAILIFTDFFCWAPISFFGLTAVFGRHLVSLEDAKIFTVFVLPLNSCANPFLYAILTKQFKKDCSAVCKRFEEFTIHRNLNRLSQRNTVTWGSSRRPSALNSFFDKRDSVSRQSVSGASGPAVTRSNSVLSSIRNFMGRSNSKESKRSCNHIRGEDLMMALGPQITTCANPVVETGDVPPPTFDSTQDVCLCRSNAEINEQDFNSNSDSSTGGTCIAHFFRKSKGEESSSRRHRKLAHSVSCPGNKVATKNDLSVLQLVSLKHSPGGVRKLSGGQDCPCTANKPRNGHATLTETPSAGMCSVKTTTTAETELPYIPTYLSEIEDDTDHVSHDCVKENVNCNKTKQNSKDMSHVRKVGDVHFKDKAKLLGLNEYDIIDICLGDQNDVKNPLKSDGTGTPILIGTDNEMKGSEKLERLEDCEINNSNGCSTKQGNSVNCDTKSESGAKSSNSHLMSVKALITPNTANLERETLTQMCPDRLGNGSCGRSYAHDSQEISVNNGCLRHTNNNGLVSKSKTKKERLEDEPSITEMDQLLEK